MDTWSKNDLNTLLENLEKYLPAKELYSLALKSVDWDKVAFENNSADGCQAAFNELIAMCRTERTVSEIFNDLRLLIRNPPDINKIDNSTGNNIAEPPSAYSLFVSKKRKKLEDEYPNASPKQITRMLVERYRQLPPEKRARYERKSALLEESFFNEISTCESGGSQGTSSPKKPTQSKLVKLELESSEEPKAPREIYFLELKANDPKITKKLALQQYAQLSEEEHLVYIQKAKEIENKYMAEHPDYKGTCLNAREKAVLKRQEPPKIKRPPNSGYALFTKKALSQEDVRNLPFKDRMSYISEMWKNLPESKREHLNAKAKLAYDQFKVDHPQKIKIKQKKKKIEPEQPPKTPYDLFVKRCKENNILIDHSELWANITPSEIDELNSILKAMKIKYLSEYTAYLEEQSAASLIEQYKRNSDSSEVDCSS